MAKNKIVYGNETLIDLTGDTVVEDALVVGYTAHGADGELVAGGNPYKKAETDTTVQTQSDLIDQIKAALEGKAAPGGGVQLPTLTNPGGAADLRNGKQLIDQAGQIVDGTLEEVQQATPSISVSSAGLITATAGDKSATHQLSSSDSSTFSESNIRKGVNLFGKTGTMRPMNTASFDDFTAGDGYIEFINTDFFGDVTSPSTLVVENAWVSIIIGTQYNSFAREMLFMTNNLSVTGANGYFRLYEVGDEKKECTTSLSFSGGAIKLRIESEEFAGLSNSSSDSLYVYMVMGAFAYTC